MKYTLIVILACLPLAFLTVSSFIELFAGTAGADLLGGEELSNRLKEVRETAAEARRKAAEVKRAVERDSPLINYLAGTYLLDARQTILKREDALPAPAAGPLRTVGQRWELTEKVRSRVVDYVRLPNRLPGARASIEQQIQYTEQEIADLTEFKREAAELAAVPAAQPLLSIVDSRLKARQQEQGRLDRSRRTGQALQKAVAQLKAGDFAACEHTLASDPLDQFVDAETQAQVDLLRERNGYRQSAEPLLKREPAAKADRVLLAALEAFLKKYPSPPTAEELPWQEALEKKRAELRRDVAVDNLGRPKRLDELLALAVAIVSDRDADELTKAAVREKVRDWLHERHFPPFTAPADLRGKQEAVQTNGTRLIGVFHRPNNGGPRRFWRNRADQQRLQYGEMQVSDISLASDPAVPQYVQWAGDYSDRRAKLVFKSVRKEDWLAFVSWCDDTQKAIEAYQKLHEQTVEPDRSCQWDFNIAGRAAQAIVDRWTQYELVMRE